MTDLTNVPGVRASRRAAPGRQRALSVLAAVAALLVAGIAVDVFAAAKPAPPAAPVEQGAAAAGSWYCPAVAGEGERARLTVAAVGEQPSSVIVVRYAKGRAVPDEPREVTPAKALVLDLEGDAARSPLAVRWTGGPAVATWRLVGDATASAPCEPAPAQRWHIAGFNSTRGLRSTLHLFNPFTADAVVRLVFSTPEGEVRLVLAENVPVGAGQTTSVDLRRFQPEQTDLGVTVEVLSGRVVAQGEQTIAPPPRTKGASGRMLLSGAPSPQEHWYFGFAADGEDTETWLSVLNPGDDIAAVQVRVSNPTGEVSSLLAEVSVPAGGIARVELAGASKDPTFGVTANVVNGQPVVVARTTSLTAEGASGVAGGLGASTLSTRWALAGAGTAGTQSFVSLYNPGAEPATVSVEAPGAPRQWQAITLPPNGRDSVGLASAGRGLVSVPVAVSADVPIVAELRSALTDGDDLLLWLNLGIPEGVWLGPPSRPPVRRDPALSTAPGEAEPSEPEIAPEFDDAPVEVEEGAS